MVGSEAWASSPSMNGKSKEEQETKLEQDWTIFKRKHQQGYEGGGKDLHDTSSLKKDIIARLQLYIVFI